MFGFTWCYLQQTVHFFQSDTNAVIPNKLAFTNFHCSISNYTLKALRSNTPSHKHDSSKYQSKAFVTCDHKSDQTRSATHVNKPYLVWLMYWWLFTQYYQHRTNQKLRSWVNAVFQNRGVCGQAFPSLPSPSPTIPFFCSRPNFLHELEWNCLLRRLCKQVRLPLILYIAGLCPERSTKHSFTLKLNAWDGYLFFER